MKVNNAVIRAGTYLIAGSLVIALAGPVLASGASPTPAAPAATPAPGRAKRPGRKPAVTFGQGKSACEAAVQTRLTSIGTTQDKVQSNHALTASDKATLLAQLSADSTGLRALGVKIAGDTDPAQLKADCRSIVTDYYWFAMERPKVRLVIAADTAGVIAQKFNDVSPRLQGGIDRAKAAGKNVTQAQTDEAALNAEIRAGLAAASPVPSMVLPLTAKDYISASEKATLLSARDDIKAAQDHFLRARADVRRVIADLKALRTPRKAAGSAHRNPATPPSPAS